MYWYGFMPVLFCKGKCNWRLFANCSSLWLYRLLKYKLQLPEWNNMTFFFICLAVVTLERYRRLKSNFTFINRWNLEAFEVADWNRGFGDINTIFLPLSCRLPIEFYRFVVKEYRVWYIKGLDNRSSYCLTEICGFIRVNPVQTNTSANPELRVMCQRF